jgi:DNA polymerase I-like protein with 3'-5' exonuclease and polymerase domains
MAAANKRGYIKTIMGRRSHFDQWSAGFVDGKPTQAYSLEKAKTIYKGQRLERAYTSKALNRLIQGSAADQTKVAMVELWKQGIDLRLPVHDELNAMVTSDKEVKMIAEIMEHAIELRVPTVADIDLGATWC